MNQPSPAWQQTASMANPRTHLNLTILPDDTVLATGGSTDIGAPTHAQTLIPSPGGTSVPLAPLSGTGGTNAPSPGAPPPPQAPPVSNLDLFFSVLGRSKDKKDGAGLTSADGA
jgi:hypothetical protein